MKAVCDASVLIFFSKLKKLDLLLTIFPKTLISGTVFSEIMAGKEKGFLDCLEIGKKVKTKKIILVNLKKVFLSGEESTIFLAQKKKISIILMDDYVGIKKASLQGLTAYSCPFILLKALKEKHIEKKEFDELLDKLLSYNYYISPRLLKKIIELSQLFAGG